MKLSAFLILLFSAVPAAAELEFLRGLQTCNPSTCKFAVPATCAISTSETGKACDTLYGGQNIAVGEVCAAMDYSSGSAKLKVTYNTIESWYMEQTHLWVGTTSGGYPQTPTGNPKIGNFPYSQTYGRNCATGVRTSSFIIDLGDLGACDCANKPSIAYYMMAHAALYKCTSGTVVQTETGWRNGKPVVERGSWATQSSFCVQCGCETGGVVVDPTGKCETAFIKCANSIDFCDGIYNQYGITLNRWGWTNIIAAGSGSIECNVYAGAGRCDISKGYLAGKVAISYTADGIFDLTWTAANGYNWCEIQVYVGSEVLPRDVTGGYTVAPGQYPYVEDTITTPLLNWVVNDLDSGVNPGPWYLVGHAVSCNAATEACKTE